SANIGLAQWMIALILSLVIALFGFNSVAKLQVTQQFPWVQFGLGIGWVLIAILPPISLANDIYWLTSSRFFYIGSVGSSFAFALLIKWLLERPYRLASRITLMGSYLLLLFSAAGLLGVNHRWYLAS